MGVKLLESLDMQTGLPLDSRDIVESIEQRDLIDPTIRYIGMEVYVENENKKYRLEKGIENFNWIDKDTIKASQLVTDSEHLTVTQSEKDTWNGKAEKVHTHNALTIKLNGTSQGAYDCGSAKEINITAESVGAQPKGSYAPSSHTHTANQVVQDANNRFVTDAEKSKWNSKAEGVHTHTKNQITDFPSTMPNPTAITIQTNGTSLGSYDGSAAKTFNLTASNVGAYTKAETNNLLNGKANSSHGYHVPTPQSANNKVFLRNDNTWHTITPQEIGAQPAGNYSVNGHTHDDRYYTEGEINNLLNGKANSSHTHPASQVTQDANNRFVSDSEKTKWNGKADAHSHPYLSTSGGTLSGALTVQGNVTCSDCVTTSDKRLKKDIIKIDKALEKVNQLNGYTFLKEGDEQRTTGLIAQEVLNVLPEAVFQKEDGYYGVSYGNIVGLLIEAIKELQNEIENLRGGN